ncbi:MULTISPECIES: hypothetical protein [Micrococcaceae]|uniref:hypothetical protein n=1 Tax=Micrococcaceae TaxID=1268 RepID=UPI000BB6F450|nr:hypothetical protein [Glutamicibacter sp. BW78]PCC26478.1 hypothetical protein CIK75_02965 [Glutamicibacter sp. BW78]
MIAIIGGSIIGVAVALVVGQFLPARPQLAGALEIYGTAPAESGGGLQSRKDRIGQMALRHAPAALGAPVSKSDLLLLGINEVDHYYRKFVSVVLGVVLAFALGFYAQGVGLPFLTVPLVSVAPLTVVMWRRPDTRVRREAARARREFARGIGTFVELVAAEIQRGAAVSNAISNAAGISDSWIFQKMSQTLTRASLNHQQPWDALADLAQELESQELEEVAGISRMAGSDGAAIYESLRSAGRNLRMKELTREHEEANRVSGRIDQQVTWIVMAFVGIVVTPMIIALNA